ncbi:MAG: C2 family cysteine protease [Myxococcota bacterium]
MLSLKDLQLSKLYGNLESKAGSKIDDSNLIDVLTAVGDSSSKSATKIRKLLLAAPSRDGKLALVKAGMNANEKKDLENILDNGTVPMTDAVRAFLSEVVGRTGGGGGGGGNGTLQVTGDQKVGLSGFGHAGDSIEAINLSTAPTGRYHLDDTVEIAKVGGDGKFSGKFIGQLSPTREGDIIRLRARDSAGKTSDWVTIRAKGISTADTSNAEIALFRVSLSDAGSGKIDVSNMNSSRQISEPGALVRFVNSRTGDAKIVTLDDTGNFPAGTKLDGKPGDVFSVAVSDGVNNKTLSTTSGKLTVPIAGGGGGGNGVDLPDPKLHKDELNPDGTPKYKEARFRGPLFVSEISPEDVRQGQLGDCYFPSAIAAMAQANPDVFKDMIVQNEDKTYTVTFKQKNWGTGKYTDVRVNIDGDLWVRPWGGPLYGSSANSAELDKMELWFPLLEKAYASWKGSYDAIGNGGSSGRVFQDLLGIDYTEKNISEGDGAKVFAWAKHAVDNKLPASVGTYGESEDARYTNSGLYSDHSYSVMDTKIENGKQMIQLRNPWGESEPGNDGKNDGIFWIEASKVAHYFETFYSIEG